MTRDTYYIRSQRGMRVARVFVDDFQEVQHMELLMSDGSAIAGWAFPRASIYNMPELRTEVDKIGWTLEGPVSE